VAREAGVEATTADDRGDPAERLDEWKRRAEEQPDSAAAQFNLGLAFGKRGLIDRAEKAYRRALALDPDLVEAWVNLGGVLLLKWDFRGCLAANAEAVKRQEDLLAAHFNIGQACLYLGDAAGLVGASRRVLSLDPQHAAGHYFLAVGLLAEGEVQQAREALGRAIALGHRPLPEFLRALERAEQEVPRHDPQGDPELRDPEST
jgi:tetratricopeptide (TPR) repeat protein